MKGFTLMNHSCILIVFAIYHFSSHASWNLSRVVFFFLEKFRYFSTNKFRKFGKVFFQILIRVIFLKFFVKFFLNFDIKKWKKNTAHGGLKKKILTHFLGQRKLDEVYESALASSSFWVSSRTSSYEPGLMWGVFLSNFVMYLKWWSSIRWFRK
jgi:hypothetical protein